MLFFSIAISSTIVTSKIFFVAYVFLFITRCFSFYYISWQTIKVYRRFFGRFQGIKFLGDVFLDKKVINIELVTRIS